MYCPQCGQSQVSEQLRYCSRCGFPLAGITDVLAQGGVVSSGGIAPEDQTPSPRRLGVKQGVMMMLFGVVIVPIMAILSDYSNLRLLDLLVPLSAVICFCGGLMRILYALLFEKGAASMPKDLPAYVPPARPAQLYSQPRASALPPAQSMPVSQFQHVRGTTAELVPPPSVTEGTTRLLDEEKSSRGE